MEIEMHIKGSLATLPGTSVTEQQFLSELERRGMAPADARLALEKALLEGWVARSPGDHLTKLDRALTDAVPGNLAPQRLTGVHP